MMMTTAARKTPSLTAAWEQGAAFSGRPVAVEFTFTAPQIEDESVSPRLPLNLGLAIDRSGSMGGGKIVAARQAAIGLLDGLSDGERFAAVAFDNEILDLAKSTMLDDTARTKIRPKLTALDARGSTALFDGFARAAELVALGGHPRESASWVLVLSDGQGNQGLQDPAEMKTHAAALAERGIRTISIGIGSDYEAAQLKALSDGGCGEFHHASQPGEIVEIALGELRALRETAASDLRMKVTVRGARRWMLLGGEMLGDAESAAKTSRFDRVRSGRTARVVALVWPHEESGEVSATLDASWLDRDMEPAGFALTTACPGGGRRARERAPRAATLWHAEVLARAMELNERREYAAAEEFVRGVRREFAAYVDGLAEAPELLGTLDMVADRVSHHWSSRSHRETYNSVQKMRMSKADLRMSAPVDLSVALAMDD
jgi:Mg-chelatase subunit ChlD